MAEYTVNDLRQMFLDFFAARGHQILPSASLVPENDNSLLLINSGMAPLKAYFTGQTVPPSNRVASCQKCVRTGDIDSIGKTTRHGTFFEMLGNFSFGDYGKKEALKWTWEFLTKVVGLDPDRLYPSVYLNDDEAFSIWENDIGVAANRIYHFGKKDNFWEHGAGPCGPCSEVYYDRGPRFGCGDSKCTIGCDCDRYIEIWNNVFTQYDGDGKGNYTDLPNLNIDTGMGLERLAVAVQDAESIFEIDTILTLRERVCALAGKEYNKKPEWDVSIRIITDHIRSATFLISDGIMPANEGRGYVLRRIIRRAARHGRLLGIKGIFLSKLSDTVIASGQDGYPELLDKREFIHTVLGQEEQNFAKTIDQGLAILNQMIKTAKKQKEDESADEVFSLPGEQAFKLYDTYGFPIDLTVEIMAESGHTVDMKGFKTLMKEQKDKARKARKETNYMGADATVYEDLDPGLKSEFIGYDRLSCEADVVAMTTESEVVQALSAGEIGAVVTTQTTFYPSGGGQTGDRGIITVEDGGEFLVTDTLKLANDKIAHIGKVTLGVIKNGNHATLSVDASRRFDTCKNHSTTHLLQKALRMVIGTHVEQAGSSVDSDRLRFDFSHFAALTPEELAKVEQIVNEQIAANLPITTEEMSLDEARKAGAMALFGEKYGAMVRVVRMGDFSIELCGGTHARNTGEIGAFKIISEAGIAAGTRRIEAITGRGVFAYYEDMERMLNEAAKAMKTTPAKLGEKVEATLAELKRLQGENESLKSIAAKSALGDVENQVEEIGGVKLLAAKVIGVDVNGLRELGDQQKAKLTNCMVVLISDDGGKVNMMATADEAAQMNGAHAGGLIKAIAPLVGGGGGGRAGMAQAGGTNPDGIEAALKQAKKVLKGQLL